MPRAPPGENEGTQLSQIDNVLLRYVYLHAPHSNTQFFNLDVYAKDSKHYKDFNSDLLTYEEISTGEYTIWCVLMQFHINFAEESSLLSEDASGDKHWSKETGFLSVLLYTISRHFNIYVKRYIYMYYWRTM